MEIRRFAVATLVAALTVTSCSSGDQETPSAGGSAEVGTTSDINPQDPATLQKGGNLRLVLTEFPSNFNSLHIDGNLADAGAMLRATMPRAFRIASDGSTSVNTDYFTSVELTGTDPQVVTYTINGKTSSLRSMQPAARTRPSSSPAPTAATGWALSRAALMIGRPS